MIDFKQDPRVIAIRADKLVGRGSCTSIDECYDAVEIVQTLDAKGVETPEGAVAWARELEGLRLEQGLNQRWGEDDDWQLKAHDDFQRRLGEP